MVIPLSKKQIEVKEAEYKIIKRLYEMYPDYYPMGKLNRVVGKKWVKLYFLLQKRGFIKLHSTKGITLTNKGFEHFDRLKLDKIQEKQMLINNGWISLGERSTLLQRQYLLKI